MYIYIHVHTQNINKISHRERKSEQEMCIYAESVITLERTRDAERVTLLSIVVFLGRQVGVMSDASTTDEAWAKLLV